MLSPTFFSCACFCFRPTRSQQQCCFCCDFSCTVANVSPLCFFVRLHYYSRQLFFSPFFCAVGTNSPTFLFFSFLFFRVQAAESGESPNTSAAIRQTSHDEETCGQPGHRRRRDQAASQASVAGGYIYDEKKRKTGERVLIDRVANQRIAWRKGDSNCSE